MHCAGTRTHRLTCAADPKDTGSAAHAILTLPVGHAAMQVTLPYTLAVFFVRDFASGPQDTEEHVGRLTGLLV